MLLSVALAACDPGCKLRTVLADDTEPKSKSHMRTVKHGRAHTVNYKFTHTLPSKPREYLRRQLPIMRVTAGAPQIINQPAILGEIAPQAQGRHHDIPAAVLRAEGVQQNERHGAIAQR